MSETRPKHKTYSPEEIAAVRQRLAALREAEDLSYRAIGAESGVPAGTISGWLVNKYAGDNGNIAARVERWLANRAERAKVRAAVPQGPGFVETETAEQIMQVLGYAQSLPDIVTITGGAGVGKTSAVCEYTRRGTNVFKTVLDPSVNTVRGLLGKLATACGVFEASHLTYRITEGVMRRLQGAQALLVLDEAQHLRPEQLDTLRAFHDQARCGIALVGNETVVGTIDGEGRQRKSEFAQLHSRVGMRMRVARPRSADTLALLAAWNIEAEDVRQQMRAIARLPGGLRNVERTIGLARLLASREGEPLNVDHVRAAYQQRAGQPLPEAA